jgi:S-methylmethionine-dependent homocysteine/selenocysteine methylase
MAKYREKLPQLGDRLFLTDGGIETTLIFHEGLDLPDFAAFHLLKTSDGEAALRKYFRTYAEIATRFATGLVLESATWRANPDWATRLGYSSDELAHANRQAIRLLEEVRDEYETERTPVVISGCVGPRGDGYVPGTAMSAPEAEAYHSRQVETFASTAADMVCAITMNYAEEAIGIVRAARRTDMPVAISFTVERDGSLPTGQTLRAAVEQVDAETSGYTSYYAINCAHPSHFEHVLADGGAWLQRIRALRANASTKSHAELNESVALDIGDPAELAGGYARLKDRLRQLNVMGGCCGTDHRHVTRIAETCATLFSTAT